LYCACCFFFSLDLSFFCLSASGAAQPRFSAVAGLIFFSNQELLSGCLSPPLPYPMCSSPRARAQARASIFRVAINFSAAMIFLLPVLASVIFGDCFSFVGLCAKFLGFRSFLSAAEILHFCVLPGVAALCLITASYFLVGLGSRRLEHAPDLLRYRAVRSRARVLTPQCVAQVSFLLRSRSLL
jgi:hypothetical protein